MAYATVSDIASLFRTLTSAEQTKANALIPIVEDELRQKAILIGKDLDEMVGDGEILPNVLKSVIVDVVARALMTSTEGEPMSQYSQSALGYTVSGTFLNPGGGLFVKRSELERLGLRRQKVGVIEVYGNDKRHNRYSTGKNTYGLD